MRFENFVGLRYLMAKRDRNMLSVITLISVGGVAVGVMALIVVLSVMGGFEADFREKIIGSKAHVVVSAQEGYLENYDALIERILKVDRVQGTNAYVEAEVMLNSPTNLQVAVIRGIDSQQITTTTKLAEYMEEGKLSYLDHPEECPSVSLNSVQVRRGSLSIQSDPEDGALTPESIKERERAGAKASIAFTGSKHGAWVAGKDVIGDKAQPQEPETIDGIPVPTEPPEIIVDDDDVIDDEPAKPRKMAPIDFDSPTVAEAPTENVKKQAPTQIADDDLSEEDRLLLEEIGEDRWVTDEPARQPSMLPLGSEEKFDREPTAEIVGVQTQKRSMKAIPGLTGDSGARRVGGIILGRELRMNLSMYMGGELNVMSPTGDVGPAGGLPKSRPFKLVGSYYSGMFDFDAKMGYISMKDAQALLGIGDTVTGIDVKCSRMEDSIIVRDALRAELSDVDNIQVDDWMTLNSSLFSAIMLEKIAMFTILTSIILVASFNILCLLIMMVIEKAREIAIFKAMGTKTSSVVQIFVVQGAMIGILGTVIGCILGLGICWLISSLGLKLPGGVYYITQIPVHVVPIDIVVICIASIGISLMATVLPSIMAVRLNPCEGLRHE